jgi:hypothetical protein
MNIIFGDTVENISSNYTVLELDTIRVSQANKIITAYCLIETIPLAEFPQVENNKHTHASLIKQYKNRNWDFCNRAIEVLLGRWNGEVDSFYNELLARIEKFKIDPPPDDWDGIVDR